MSLRRQQRRIMVEDAAFDALEDEKAAFASNLRRDQAFHGDAQDIAEIDALNAMMSDYQAG